jgi:hypothetical protein
MAAIKYPSTLPCPLIDGFGADIASGLLRGDVGTSDNRQRRRHHALTHTYSMSFVIKQAKDLGKWMNWVDVHGFKWFTMELPGALAGTHNAEVYETLIRFIGPIQNEIVRLGDTHYWRVSVQAESIWSAAKKGVSPPTLYDRVVARSPGNPSIDRIIAKTPAGPSTDRVVAPDLRGI